MSAPTDPIEGYYAQQTGAAMSEQEPLVPQTQMFEDGAVPPVNEWDWATEKAWYWLASRGLSPNRHANYLAALLRVEVASRLERAPAGEAMSAPTPTMKALPDGGKP